MEDIFLTFSWSHRIHVRVLWMNPSFLFSFWKCWRFCTIQDVIANRWHRKDEKYWSLWHVPFPWLWDGFRVVRGGISPKTMSKHQSMIATRIWRAAFYLDGKLAALVRLSHQRINGFLGFHRLQEESNVKTPYSISKMFQRVYLKGVWHTKTEKKGLCHKELKWLLSSCGDKKENGKGWIGSFHRTI